jgi:hypothetical protein
MWIYVEASQILAFHSIGAYLHFQAESDGLPEISAFNKYLPSFRAV